MTRCLSGLFLFLFSMKCIYLWKKKVLYVQSNVSPFRGRTRQDISWVSRHISHIQKQPCGKTPFSSPLLAAAEINFCSLSCLCVYSFSLRWRQSSLLRKGALLPQRVPQHLRWTYTDPQLWQGTLMVGCWPMTTPTTSPTVSNDTENHMKDPLKPATTAAKWWRRRHHGRIRGWALCGGGGAGRSHNEAITVR